MAVRLGIDTGGTFTDLIGIDAESGALVVAKTPSTPARPVDAIMNAIALSGADPQALAGISIGTTVATNALLQRNGATVIFVTTRGFEDIPHIQRMNRKHHFSLTWTKPRPLVERRNCLGVAERLDFHGAVLTPLTEEALEELAGRLAARLADYPGQDTAIAVCLLFAYVNPAHELRLRAFLRQRFPEVPVSLSHEVAPIWREYERGSTAIADGYVKPIMQRYIADAFAAFNDAGLHVHWSLMKSNGGKTPAAAAAAEPIKFLLSGLAGGIIAGHYFGQLAGARNLVTLDMGGTSCDVGLVREGRIAHSTTFEIEWGLPVATPTIDLTTIGAGGGSIAWIDKGGLLRVGPQSAGADPGPVCYDTGGDAVTVTDANLVLGRLNPAYFLGGRMQLTMAKAAAKLDELGQRFGMGRLQIARAVVDIANENMANAIRVLSIDRGLDPREYTLVAFGGAGPLHASDIAAKMGMTRVVIPVYPGLTSAFGALIAAPKISQVWSKHFRSDAIDARTVGAHFASMVAAAIDQLRREGFPGEPAIERSISMRYWGQNYEQDVPLPPGAVTPDLLEQTLQEFHRLHEQVYGYSISGEVIELIRFNVTVSGHTGAVSLPARTLNGRHSGGQPVGERPVYFQGHGLLDTPIYRRDDLPAGFAASGPLIVEEISSTTVIHPGQRLEIGGTGVMTIDLARVVNRQSDIGATPASPAASEVEVGQVIEQRGGRIDPVTLSVINNAFVNVCREMGTAMMRTSYSPIFNEGLDFSCMLFNTRGDLIGQAEFCPTMLGSCQYAMKWMLDEVGLAAFGPGDVYIHNDPYRGQCHMPEHLVVKAVFHEGKPWGFVGNIAHVGEIGGMAPGSFAADATEVYQEGLRLPPLKIMAGGAYVKDIWRVILANHRTPKTSWGDYHAMIGSLTVAEARVRELLAKYGAATLTAASDQLLDYAERFMRAEIAEMPDGVYYAQDQMEDDGITKDPYWMRLRLTIRGDEAICDWTDSDEQAKGPINATFVVTAAACYSGFLHVVSSDIPINSGAYRPIRLVTRPGSLLNVKHPGPSVGGNTETHPHIQNVVLRALAGAVPERVQAGEGASSCNFLFGGFHPEYGDYYTNYHIEGSGWGGAIDHDGNNVLCPNNGNCRNTPVEILETKYPFIVEEYRLRPDSAGAGRWRGGLASSRVFRVNAPEITVNALFDRTRTHGPGIFGGREGASSGIFIQRPGDAEFRRFSQVFGTVSDSKFTRVAVTMGDRIQLDSAGGGGFGDPRQRPRELVAEDVRQGVVSPAAARELYGYEPESEEKA